jgi:hypothetical protein
MVELPRYGDVNLEYMLSWLNLADDEPMWALNLMKYRPRAEYADGRATSLSGKDADDAYSPVGPLAKVGARVLLLADVVAQPVGDATVWDRVAIAQYPERKAMMTMQMDEEFERAHEHKDAGMAFTIVAATFPQPGTLVPEEVASTAGTGDRLLLELVADAGSPILGDELGGVLLGRFRAEEVVVGDARRWAEARWHVIEPDVASDLAARAPEVADDRYVVVLDPFFDQIAQSVRDHVDGTFPAGTD